MSAARPKTSSLRLAFVNAIALTNCGASQVSGELRTRCSLVLAVAVLLSCGVLAAGCGNSGGFPTTGPSPLPSSGGATPADSQPAPVVPETPFATLDGSYRMTFVADGCQDSFPSAYRTR